MLSVGTAACPGGRSLPAVPPTVNEGRSTAPDKTSDTPSQASVIDVSGTSGLAHEVGAWACSCASVVGGSGDIWAGSGSQFWLPPSSLDHGTSGSCSSSDAAPPKPPATADGEVKGTGPALGTVRFPGRPVWRNSGPGAGTGPRPGPGRPRRRCGHRTGGRRCLASHHQLAPGERPRLMCRAP